MAQSIFTPTTAYDTLYESTDDDMEPSPQRGNNTGGTPTQAEDEVDDTETGGQEKGESVHIRYKNETDSVTKRERVRLQKLREARDNTTESVGDRLYRQRKPTGKTKHPSSPGQAHRERDSDRHHRSWNRETKVEYCGDDGMVAKRRYEGVERFLHGEGMPKSEADGPDLSEEAGRRLYKLAMDKDHRLKQLREQSIADAEKAEVKDCTFAPAISEATEAMRAGAIPIHERYQSHVAKANARVLANTASERSREGKECSFRPEVNPQSTKLVGGNRSTAVVAEKLFRDHEETRLRLAAKEAALSTTLQNDIVGGGIVSGGTAKQTAARLAEWRQQRDQGREQYAKATHRNETAADSKPKHVDVSAMLDRLVPNNGGGSRRGNGSNTSNSSDPLGEVSEIAEEEWQQYARERFAYLFHRYTKVFDTSKLSYEHLKALIMEKEPRNVTMVSALHSNATVGGWMNCEQFCEALLMYEEDFGPQRWSDERNMKPQRRLKEEAETQQEQQQHLRVAKTVPSTCSSKKPLANSDKHRLQQPVAAAKAKPTYAGKNLQRLQPAADAGDGSGKLTAGDYSSLLVSIQKTLHANEHPLTPGGMMASEENKRHRDEREQRLLHRAGNVPANPPPPPNKGTRTSAASTRSSTATRPSAKSQPRPKKNKAAEEADEFLIRYSADTAAEDDSVLAQIEATLRSNV